MRDVCSYFTKVDRGAGVPMARILCKCVVSRGSGQGLSPRSALRWRAAWHVVAFAGDPRTFHPMVPAGNGKGPPRPGG